MDEGVAVVVVNWNGRSLLEACLASVAAQSLRAKEVVLVDNGSLDGSLELVRARFPWVRLLTNERNVGFAAANNQGIAATRSDYVALLNNDAQADPRWLESLVAAMQGDPQIGSCASRMLLADAEGVVDSAGIELDVTGLAWGRLGGTAASGEAAQAPAEVFGASAGAALYRRAMLREIGGFDEDFQAYLEDVDLAWRARLAGWRCLYVPGAMVRHAHSGTVGRESPLKSRLLGRNKLWLILKNYPAPQLAAFTGLIVAYECSGLAYRLFAHRDVAALQGRLEALAGLRQVWRKRRAVQRLRRVPFGRIGLRGPVGPREVLRRYRFLAPTAPARTGSRA